MFNPDLVEVELSEATCPYPTRVTTGAAGTGKTSLIRAEIANNPKAYLLTATTGIAAVNMGDNCSTIHSTLGFYNTESLIEAAIKGRITRKLIELAKAGVRWIVLDEISMFSARAMDTLHNCLAEAAEFLRAENLEPVGLWCSGDPAQLGPIEDTSRETNEVIQGTGQFFFEALCWEHYAPNMERLTKIWRQDNEWFLHALGFARVGDGVSCVAALQQCGVEFAKQFDTKFDGSTLRGTNAEVDRFNQSRLLDLPGNAWKVQSFRWGLGRYAERGPAEWDSIPVAWHAKKGALVILLENKREYDDDGEGRRTSSLLWVNGEQGVVEEFIPGQGFRITLRRTGAEIILPFSIRPFMLKEAPAEWADRPKAEWPKWRKGDAEPEYGKPYYDTEREQWCWGQVAWYPMRLAFSTSVFRSQGLTLDKVQIDASGGFMSTPGMMYVALSRVRGPEGLRIYGTPEVLVKRIRVDERVRGWL